MVHSEEEIVAGLKEGDINVFNALYKKYLPIIIRHVLDNSGNKDDGEDLCQETLIALTNNVRAGKFFAQNVNGYINSIYKRLWLKKIRDRDRKKGKKLAYIQSALEETAEERDFLKEEAISQKVMNHLSQLSDECQKIINLKIWDKKAHKEIAEIVGIAPGSSRTQYVRCLSYLKKLCKDDPDFSF